MQKTEKKLRKKENPELVRTIIIAKKNKAWKKISNLLLRVRRKQITMNLEEIDSKAKEGDTIVVPGKVLGTGNLSKKLKIVSFSISSSAREKMKKTKSEYAGIEDEIRKNKKAEGVKVLWEK